MKEFVLIITYFVLLYPLVMSLIWIIGALKFQFQKKDIPEAKNKMPFTILLSIYNEEEDIEEHLKNNLNLDYDNYKIIAIDDKSLDGTWDILNNIKHEKLKVYQNEENIGKAASLNKLTKYVDTDFFVVIDSDTILDKNFFNIINNKIEYDKENNESKIGGYTGNVTVSARNPNKVFRMQKIEYRAFIDMIKRTQSTFTKSVMTLSGACSIYNTEAFYDIGMFSTESATEDINISWRFNLNGYKLKYVSNALAAVTTPTNVFDLIMQRKRWTNGLLQTMFKYKSDFIKPRNIDLKLYLLEIVVSSLWAFSIIYINLYYIFILFTNFNDNLRIVVFLLPTFIIFVFSTVLAIVSYILNENEKETKRELIKYYLLFPFAYFYIQPIGFLLGFIETVKQKKNEVWRQKAKVESKLKLMTFIDFIVSVVSLQLLLEIFTDAGVKFDNYFIILLIVFVYSTLMFVYYYKFHLGEQAIAMRLPHLFNPSIYLTIIFIIVRLAKATMLYFNFMNVGDANKVSAHVFLTIIVLCYITFEIVTRTYIRTSYKKEA